MAGVGGLSVGAVSQTGRSPDGALNQYRPDASGTHTMPIWPLIQALEVLEERWQRWFRGLPLGRTAGGLHLL
jgi:hypothetical protein